MYVFSNKLPYIQKCARWVSENPPLSGRNCGNSPQRNWQKTRKNGQKGGEAGILSFVFAVLQ